MYNNYIHVYVRVRLHVHCFHDAMYMHALIMIIFEKLMRFQKIAPGKEYSTCIIYKQHS